MYTKKEQEPRCTSVYVVHKIYVYNAGLEYRTSKKSNNIIRYLITVFKKCNNSIHCMTKIGEGYAVHRDRKNWSNDIEAQHFMQRLY
jgi:hypothetical protein